MRRRRGKITSRSKTKESKTMNQQVIDKLIAAGGNRWQKSGMDRIYFKASQLGLDYSCYKTGNISSATFNGERISNSEANRMYSAKTYYNVMTNTVVSDNNTLKLAIESIIND